MTEKAKTEKVARALMRHFFDFDDELEQRYWELLSPKGKRNWMEQARVAIAAA